MVTCTFHYNDHDVINTIISIDRSFLRNQVNKLSPVTSKTIYHNEKIGTAHVVLKPFQESIVNRLFREMI